MVENVDGVEASSDEQEQSSVPDSEGHLEVVQPSDVWQTLKPGNVLAVFMCHTLFDSQVNWLIFILYFCVRVCVCISLADMQARQCQQVPMLS